MSARVALAAAFAGALVATGCGGAQAPTATPSPVVERPVAAVARGPYLQHSDTGARVVWYTQGSAAGPWGRVRWSDGQVSGESTVPSGAAPGTLLRHEAEIGPLAPASRYTYRIYSPSGLLASETGLIDFSLRTPEADGLRLVVFGDSGKGSPEQSAIAQAIAAEPILPDAVVIVGDVVYPPAEDASYDQRFFVPYRYLLPSIPFYAVPGNHDYEVDSGRPFFDIFTLPTNGPTGLPPESSYWLARGGARLIVHDSNQAVDLLRKEAVPWHTSVCRQGASFRLVFQHHGLYSSGPNGQRAPTAALRQLLGPLYSATGVDVVFNGHDHFYERSVPIGGVVYVTTGAGGAELYPRVTDDGKTAAFFNERHSYTYVELKGRELRSRQMDASGRTVDSFAITKPVSFSDPLRAFAGEGTPADGWLAAGFDDSAWPLVAARGRASALRARREFLVNPAPGASTAVVRVRDASDHVVRLNGVEVGRGRGPASYPLDSELLRAGENALTLEARVDGTEPAPPALELLVFSSARER